jgi:hypothetical protein
LFAALLSKGVHPPGHGGDAETACIMHVPPERPALRLWTAASRRVTQASPESRGCSERKRRMLLQSRAEQQRVKAKPN